MRRKERFNGVLWMISTLINLCCSVFFKIKRVSKEAPPDWKLKLVYSRSSRLYCSVKDVLRNFAKFTGKHLSQRLFFNKVVDLLPATILKKRIWHRCFPVNLANYLRTPFSTKHICWLLLVFLKKHEGH